MRSIILVVEDVKEILENITEILRLYGYDVIPMTNGQGVLETAANVKPDLVLCDILLPGLNGIDILKAFQSKDEFETTPFILLTSQSEYANQVIATQLGADDYIVKPFDGELLIQKITFHLESKMRVVHKTTKI